MDKTIARLNIEHFQKQLAEETDQAKRQTLRRLLAEEEEKLTHIVKSRQELKKSG